MASVQMAHISEPSYEERPTDIGNVQQGRSSINLSDIIHNHRLKKGEQVEATVLVPTTNGPNSRLGGRKSLDFGIVGTPKQGILYNNKEFLRPSGFLREVYESKGYAYKQNDGWRRVYYKGKNLQKIRQELEQDGLSFKKIESKGDWILIEFENCLFRTWKHKDELGSREDSTTEEEEVDNDEDSPDAAVAGSIVGVPRALGVPRSLQAVAKRKPSMIESIQLSLAAKKVKLQEEDKNFVDAEGKIAKARHKISQLENCIASEEGNKARARQQTDRLKQDISHLEKSKKEQEYQDLRKEELALNEQLAKVRAKLQERQLG